MKATFDGTVVRVGKEGRVLYEQSGYGRLEQDGVKLSDQEALYLLHRQKIELPGTPSTPCFQNLPNSPIFFAVFWYTVICGSGDMLSRQDLTISGSLNVVKNPVRESRCILSGSFQNVTRSGSLNLSKRSLPQETCENSMFSPLSMTRKS